jgi:hypothetical protein
MTRIGLTLGALLLATSVFAQTATPGNKFGFDQAAPDLASAQGYTYKIYADGAATGVVAAATCSGTAAPFACAVAIPAFTPGSHTVQLTATNAAGESAKSTAFTFTLVVVPTAPANLRVQ